MKKVTKEAKALLLMVGLTASDQNFRRAYWRNIKYGPVNDFSIANYLKRNGLTHAVEKHSEKSLSLHASNRIS